MFLIAADASALLERIQAQHEAITRRKNEQQVADAFTKVAGPSRSAGPGQPPPPPRLHRDLLPTALGALGIAGRDAVEVTDVLLLAADEDSDGDGLVSLDNFAAAVRQPLSLERWAMGIPLWRHLAAAAAAAAPAGADPLRAVAALTAADAARIAAAVGDAARAEILAHADALRRSFAEADAAAAAAAPAAPTIAAKFRIHKAGCGTVQDYRDHFKSDLSARIGPPGPARPGPARLCALGRRMWGAGAGGVGGKEG
jgi:hypothetical protein